MGNEFFLAVRGSWIGSGKESTIVNIYGPHDDASKKLMWESLDNLLLCSDSTWLLCGDFNEVREASGRLNCVFHQRRASRFNEFISSNNPNEIPISGRKFTRISDDGIKFSKLDRFFVSNKFLNLWEDLSVIPLERIESDHCTLVLRDKLIDFGPKPFKVFNEWLNKEGVVAIIQSAWDNPIKSMRRDCRFRDRLKNIKFALKDWSHNEFGKLDEEIIALKIKDVDLEKEAELGGFNESKRLAWLEVRKNWLEKESVKTSMLKQKARFRWNLEGNENSKNFHNTIKRRSNKCNIRGLCINGVWNEEPSVVKAAVFSHFHQLFSAKNHQRPTML
ncbi:uncharacterized protein [Rutidosis leptorrhynchoides]|uniref:uncharacterized protein n=1 Tax=Rutidosis leptorrhynchoides TaxID=125765 RepID=UPI003A9A49C7